MFENFPQSELTIVSPEGTIRSVEKGIVDSKLATIPNKNAVIHVGDEIGENFRTESKKPLRLSTPFIMRECTDNSGSLSGENSTKGIISCMYWRVFDI